MKISVVMATYNGQRFIQKQLDSIMEQTVRPDEIVVNDDRSKDETVDIVRAYAEKYPDIDWKINVNEVNKGYIGNFLNAIERSSGDMIVLSDQDDMWDKHKIELMQSYFEAHPDMLSLHTNYTIIDMEDKPIRENEINYQNSLEKYSVRKFVKRLNYCGMSSAFRKDIKPYLKKLDPAKLPTHDWTIHSLAVLLDGMYVSKEVVSYRRAHGDNVALNLDKKTERTGVEQRLMIVKDFLSYYMLMKKLSGMLGVTKYDGVISDLIKTQKMRMCYLKKRSLLLWLSEIGNIGFFPSAKAFLCDALYIAGIY